MKSRVGPDMTEVRVLRIPLKTYDGGGVIKLLSVLSRTNAAGCNLSPNQEARAQLELIRGSVVVLDLTRLWLVPVPGGLCRW